MIDTHAKTPKIPIVGGAVNKGLCIFLIKKVPVSVPRVRNVVTDEEVSLQTYHHLQRPRRMDEGLLLRMIKGIATRSYQACAEAIPEAFWSVLIDGIETFYQGVGRKIKTVPGTLFSTV